MGKKIVSNADAYYTFKHLLKKESEESLAVGKLKPSKSIFLLYLGLKINNEAINNNQDGCIVLCDTYDIKDQFNIGIDNISNCQIPFLVAWFPSKHQKINADFYKNNSTMQILTFAPYSTKGFWEKHRNILSDRLIDMTEKEIGNFRNYIDIQFSATPHTFHRYTYNLNGSGFGWVLSNSQIKPNILPCKTSIEDLFIAGHWTTGGIAQSGIPGVALSGRKVANLIVNELGNKWDYKVLRT